MPRQSKDGKGLKRVLQWILDRDVTDTQIASALNKPAATFHRRKDARDFPTWDELEVIGEHFGVNSRWLQVQFGYLRPGELVVDPEPLSRPARLQVRPDAPPLGE
jgi:hypothetical protein